MSLEGSARVFSLGNLLHHHRFRSLLGFASGGVPFRPRPPSSPARLFSLVAVLDGGDVNLSHLIWFCVSMADPGHLVSLLTSGKIFSVVFFLFRPFMFLRCGFLCVSFSSNPSLVLFSFFFLQMMDILALLLPNTLLSNLY